MRPSQHLPAFTALELIVVICILGLIVALLIPVIGSARRSAYVTLCASNLRQIGQAIQLYNNDQHRMPLATVMPAPFTFPAATSQAPIYERLDSYLPKVNPVYRCPEDAGRVFDKCAAASPESLGISFLYIVFPDSAPTSVKDMIMWDYTGDSLHGLIPPPHQRAGVNTLLL